MKLVVLTENTPGNGLEGEHGLSIWIQYKDQFVLLDTGQSSLFWANGEKCGIPFEKITCSVLSHGHYDHSGGYEKLLEEIPTVTVYARNTADQSYYSYKEGKMQEIGIPHKILERFRNRFIFLKEDTQILPGVWTIGNQEEDLWKRGKITQLYKKSGEQYLPDDFRHEQSLVFEEEKGVVIFNSCSHAGMDRIVEHVKEIFPEQRILAVLGGFHLKGKSGEDTMAYPEEEIKRLGKRLLTLGVEQIYTGHCTGNKAFQVLETVLGEKLHPLYTGCEICIE